MVRRLNTIITHFSLILSCLIRWRVPVTSPEHAGSSWCGRAEYNSYVVVTDRRWKLVGIGRAEDGMWVAELWEPDERGT
jgi:hypothetical protein